MVRFISCSHFKLLFSELHKYIICISIICANSSVRFMKKSQGITKVIRIQPLGTMNVCINFYVNPFNSCWDISVWTKLHVTHFRLIFILIFMLNF